MRAVGYQEHLWRNQKFSLAAVMVDPDVVSSHTRSGWRAPKISAPAQQGDTETLSKIGVQSRGSSGSVRRETGCCSLAPRGGGEPKELFPCHLHPVTAGGKQLPSST